jgi:alpha-tubulin suppressor-like RCC1 family protein
MRKYQTTHLLMFIAIVFSALLIASATAQAESIPNEVPRPERMQNDLVSEGEAAELPADVGVAAAVSASSGGPLNNVMAVAAGEEHTCALLSDGTVRCWGRNYYGQLGDGTTTDRSTPATVSGLSGATAVAAGYSHTCALLGDGTVRCWGANYSGQLGDGTTTSRHTPVTVSLPLSATAVAAGGNHTCALLGDGTVRCWGSNFFGQLGDGTTDNSRTPVTVSLPLSATAVAAGGLSHLRAAGRRHSQVLGKQLLWPARRRDDGQQPHAGDGELAAQRDGGRSGRIPHLRAAGRRHSQVLGS